MNCPSRRDTNIELDDGYNQSPDRLSADLTTRSDLSRIANARVHTDHRLDVANHSDLELRTQQPVEERQTRGTRDAGLATKTARVEEADRGRPVLSDSNARSTPETEHNGDLVSRSRPTRSCLKRIKTVLVRFSSFIGPGFMISVAYIDPGNYATDIAAGATYRFRLLFIILMANIFAIFLQSLCIKLGSVTGMNLSEMCRAYLPRWLNFVLYLFAEAAIIATDIAEVIGTAIALNLLFNVPLVAGCAISIVLVLVVLLFYRPDQGSLTLRTFEFVIGLLVVGVVICFSFQLSLITGVSVGGVFKGYLPSSAIVQTQGLYQSCGILGATVMPHSLFLGSGMVQPRLREFDKTHNVAPPYDEADDSGPTKYRPSITAIRACMSYSVVELAISLFTFALFVNSSILIVAGASLYDIPDSSQADLFGIYRLLRHSLAPAAGTVFALALLFSGVTAMIVCTIAGQMVCEGHLNLKMKPWVRALMTRSLSIVPAVIIASAVGRNGLSTALQASQVVLSVIIPVVSAPLIWFTCRTKYMTVANIPSPPNETVSSDDGAEQQGMANSNREEHGHARAPAGINMRNNWLTASAALVIWLILVVMNVALIVLAGMGDA